MSSVSRASRSVSSGSWMEFGGYRCGKGRLVWLAGSVLWKGKNGDYGTRKRTNCESYS